MDQSDFAPEVITEGGEDEYFQEELFSSMNEKEMQKFLKDS
jgi:hypothetical protein